MDELSRIADIYKCEKYSLCNYTPFYDALFNKYRDKEFNLLEIGVSKGASMRMWRDYFRNANIFGIDTDTDCLKHKGERIKIYNINQCDKPKLQELADNIGEMFIICDDGSHYGQDIIDSLSVLHKYIPKGGFYVVEDILPEYKKEVENFIDTLPLQKILFTLPQFRPEVGCWILKNV